MRFSRVEEASIPQGAGWPGTLPAHLHRIASVVLFVVGVAALAGSFQLSLGALNNPGPGLWPFISAIFLTIVSIVLFIVDDSIEHEAWTRRALVVAGGLLSLAVFIVLFEAIGFLISAFLMLLLWLRIFGQEPWRLVIPLSVVGPVAMHFLFVVALGVPVPDDVVVSLLSAIGA